MVFSAIAGFLAIVSLTIAVLPNSDYALKMAFVTSVAGLGLFGSSAAILSYNISIVSSPNATKIHWFLAKQLYRRCFKDQGMIRMFCMAYFYLALLFFFFWIMFLVGLFLMMAIFQKHFLSGFFMFLDYSVCGCVYSGGY
ncbi:hypothetical protein O0544_20615 [Edwardsiella anguillarum]|nr:hypothetical protein [Edwardsiella anguillarum]